MKTMRSRVLALPLLATGLAATGAAAAQSMDTRDLAPTQTRMISCGQVDMAWNVDLITQYPRIPEACFEVITNNGIKWARFEADFVRLDRDGSVVADFQSPGGDDMGRYTVLNRPGQQVTLDGRRRPFSDLRAGQRISLYVPEGAAALTTAPGLPPDQYGRIIRYEDPAPEYYAQAEPTRTRRLPTTAGPLPWFAAAGVVALLGGVGLRRARKD